jgi:FkbM family methyltransferase
LRIAAESIGRVLSIAVAQWRSVWSRQRLIDRFLARAIRPPEIATFQKLGSDYGGWVVPTSILAREWICYCGGVGEDITFDLELIRRYGCEVFAFDPTPRAAAHVRATAAAEKRYHFLPVGLWSDDRELRFYAPRNREHVSHSIVNLQGTHDFFTARCRPIVALMRDLGHSRIDLLKLDIEGAQHEVLRGMLRDHVHPRVICVEFDQPDTLLRMYRSYRRLRRADYVLAVRDGWNLTFIQAA